MKTFGDRLKSFRKESGLTQEAIALEVGLTKSAVSQWEANASQPDFASLLVLRDLLGVTLDELIGGAKATDGERILLSAQERELIQLFRKLTPKRRAAALQLLSH